MTYAERILGYLWSIAPDGATNRQIADRLSIQSQQTVYLLTQELLRKGLIRGEQNGNLVSDVTFYFLTDDLPTSRCRTGRGEQDAVSTEPMAARLEDVLSTMTVESLKPLARRCANPLPTRKHDLIRVINQALQSKEFVAEQLHRADETTRLALAEAAHGGGVFDGAGFAAKYGRAFAAPSHVPYSWSSRRTESDDSPAILFLYNGRIPSDLIPLLKQLLPVPAPFVIPSQTDLPTEAPGVGNQPFPLTTFLTEEPALHDVVATLTLVGQGKAAVSEATKQPSAPTIRLLRERLLLPDIISPMDGTRADETVRPFALIMIVQAAGLARAKGTRLELTRAGQAALEQPTVDLLKKCWESWLTWDEFDELSRVRGIKGQRTRGQRLSRPSERKEALADALASCPPGRWIAIQDFFRHVRAGKHDFAVDTSEPTRLYVGYDQEYGWLGYSGVDFWRIVNASYIRVVLLEYSVALGLIDMATISGEEAKLDFRLDWDYERDAAAIQGVSPALLIQCADPHTAQLIAHDRVMSKLCRLAGDTEVVVANKQLTAFRRGLRRLGFVLSDDQLGPGTKAPKRSR